MPRAQTVRQMHFDKRDFHRRQRVAHGDAGMSKSCGVDDDEIDTYPLRLLNTIDEFAFNVTLIVRKLDAGLLRAIGEPAIDIGECR